MTSPLLRIFVVSVLLSVARAACAEENGSPADQKQRAISAIEQSIKSDPNNAELWVHLGFAYRKLDQIDKAKEAFEKASSLNSKNQEALYMLGLIYESKNQTQDALRVWQQYLQVATDPAKRATAENHITQLKGK